MFKVYCPTHRSEVLLSPRRIERLRPTPHGLMVEWRCWCGKAGQSIDGRPIAEIIPEAS